MISDLRKRIWVRFFSILFFFLHLFRYSLFACSIILLFVTLSCSSSYAQEEPPFSFKLNQINNDTVRVIFQQGLEEKAQRVANIINYISAKDRASIGNQHKKINIVLQNHTVISNGYVALSPFRSEFYISPLQSTELGGVDFIDELALHEFRHGLQFMNSKHGMLKLMYWLGGENFWALGLFGSTPNWFFEGDAVVMETALSTQGRGRLPSFFDGYKSVLLDNKKYSYLKARNGSFKDFVPDHYKLGYLLCTYGRDSLGNDFWKKVYSKSTGGVLFSSFSRAMKKYSGYNVNEFYKHALDHYNIKWADEQKKLKITPALKLNLPTRTVTNYKMPYFLTDDQWLVQKSSYKKINGFYLFDRSGKEKHLTNVGIQMDNYFGYKNNKIVWTELRYDPRWNWKTYSVVMMYDLKTNKKNQLTRKTKYFAPDINSDGSKILVSEVLPDLKYSIKIIETGSGNLVKEFKHPDNYFLTFPKWSSDEKTIYTSVRKPDGKMSLMGIAMENGQWNEIISFNNNVIGMAFPKGDTVYFESSINGIDNIFAVKLSTKQIYQATSRPVGAYNPSVNASGNELAFVDLTSMGNNLSVMKISPENFVPINNIIPLDELPQFKTTAIEKEGGDILSKSFDRKDSVTRYQRAGHLLKFHSWEPLAGYPNIGLTLLSDNIIGNASATVSVLHNFNENNNVYATSLNYSGLPVVMGISGEYYSPRIKIEDIIKTSWREFAFLPYIALPISAIKGVYRMNMNVLVNYQNRNIYYMESSANNYSVQSLGGELRINNAQSKARQNIYSHFAQNIFLAYDKSINNISAESFFFGGDFFFRGLAANHNFVVQAAYQTQNRNNIYMYSDNMFYARGYVRPISDRVRKIGLNYHFPLWYPEKGIRGLIYLSRVRTNFFYDYSIANLGGINRNYNSLGAELIFDCPILNSLSIPLGIRYSYLQNPVDAVKYNIEVFVGNISF